MTYNQIKTEAESIVDEAISEILEYDYSDNMDADDVYDLVSDRLYEVIDGHQWVIYTYQAKQVVEACDIDIFDEDEMTGERYTSWSNAAYCGLYNTITNEIDVLDLIQDKLKRL